MSEILATIQRPSSFFKVFVWVTVACLRAEIPILGILSPSVSRSILDCHRYQDNGALDSRVFSARYLIGRPEIQTRRRKIRAAAGRWRRDGGAPPPAIVTFGVFIINRPRPPAPAGETRLIITLSGFVIGCDFV